MYKASIIIAAYNVENYIEKCINSALNQTLNDIEVIVVNDGSTDNTLNVINKIAKNNRILKVINQINSGVQKTREEGFKIATGEYVLFVDGDDWIENNTIEILYNKGKENDLDIVYYKYFYVHKDNKIKCDNIIFNESNNNEFLIETLRGNIQPGICLKFIKKSFMDKNDILFPLDIGYGEDLAFTILLAVNNPKVGFINEYLYNYFKREDSVTNNITKKVFDIVPALELIKSYLVKYNFYNDYREIYEYLSWRHLYINRVIDLEYGVAYKKDFYNLWKSKGINIKANIECKNYIDLQSSKKKIKLKLYEKSYCIGETFAFIIKKLKGVKK